MPKKTKTAEQAYSDIQAAAQTMMLHEQTYRTVVEHLEAAFEAFQESQGTDVAALERAFANAQNMLKRVRER